MAGGGGPYGGGRLLGSHAEHRGDATSGTTAFADMYFFMEEVARAVSETGIRADLSIGMVSDRR